MEVHGNTYTLQDITTLKTCRVDVSRLKAYVEDKNRSNMELAARDAFERVVEAIVDHKGSPKQKAKMKFLVHWAGEELDEATWESWKRVKDLAALDVYLKHHPELRL